MSEIFDDLYPSGANGPEPEIWRFAYDTLYAQHEMTRQSLPEKTADDEAIIENLESRITELATTQGHDSVPNGLMDGLALSKQQAMQNRLRAQELRTNVAAFYVDEHLKEAKKAGTQHLPEWQAEAVELMQWEAAQKAI